MPFADAQPRAEAQVEPAGLEALDGPAVSLLQSGFWALLKERFGWRAHPFRCSWRGEPFPLLVLTRVLGLGYGLAYVPHGPLLEPPAGEQADLLLSLGRLLPRALPPKTVFLRFDPPWPWQGLALAGSVPEGIAPQGAGAFPPPLCKAPMDIQPPSTVLVDLRPPEERILQAMKPKTRYNIRLSFRKGVEVAEEDPSRLEDWYRLYRETARRDRIGLHSAAYYAALFELAGRGGPAAPRLRLYLARHGGELLAGIIVASRGPAAWYLYGASSSRKRSLMPAYALQWHAMRQARADGCLTYDLFGIPPDDDPAHPMAGLYRFKTGFGGRIVHRTGCCDLPCLPLAYRAYRFLEQGRRLYHHRLRKLPLRSRAGVEGG
jgi:lipid II:glycine glycyltransferase (peptidoglycan interpeptide bridge formation enzyme)